MERLRGGGATTNDPTAVASRRFVAWILDSLFMAIIILVIHRSGVAFLDEAGNLTINPSVIGTATLLMVLNQVGLTMATGFSLGKAVTEALDIPVIGIGAGPDTTAQIMVLHDVLGVSPITPKFVRNFLAGSSDGIPGAIKSYVDAVKDQTFPAEEHCFD